MPEPAPGRPWPFLISAGAFVVGIAAILVIHSTSHSKHVLLHTGEVRTVAASCATPYAVTELASQAGAAFEATVSAIKDGSPSFLKELTVKVGEVYKGALKKGDDVTVTMEAPITVDGLPSYDTGEHLLIAASVVPVDGSYRALGCGFTRYFDAQTADQWSNALTPGH